MEQTVKGELIEKITRCWETRKCEKETQNNFVLINIRWAERNLDSFQDFLILPNYNKELSCWNPFYVFETWPTSKDWYNIKTGKTEIQIN